MENFTLRSFELKLKMNKHLQKLTGVEYDFYSALKHDDILELKTVLSDIHNLLTFKLTISAANWICEYFSITPIERQAILQNIDTTNPNAQGFDIIIEKPIKIIAEVKCNSPVKEGSKFGAMQSKSLLEDVGKLLNGKRQLRETDEYLKFLFILDHGKRSHDAVNQLIRKTKVRVENEERLGRNILRESIVILDDKVLFKNLDRNKVYIKVIKLE